LQTLFIGGPRDGERTDELTEHGYEVHSIRIVDHDETEEYFPILAPVGMSLGEIFRKLLGGYRP
jgi:hypothetical protein